MDFYIKYLITCRNPNRGQNRPNCIQTCTLKLNTLKRPPANQTIKSNIRASCQNGPCFYHTNPDLFLYHCPCAGAQSVDVTVSLPVPFYPRPQSILPVIIYSSMFTIYPLSPEPPRARETAPQRDVPSEAANFCLLWQQNMGSQVRTVRLRSVGCI